jgi:phosphomannomutase
MNMSAIKFGTDGWRAIIADEYTVENVKRVAIGTALFMQKHGLDKLVIGHDCRFGGEMFAETTARVLGAHGIKVHLAKGIVTTPMVSLGIVKTKSDLGVVITASHNPPSYNGYKLKSHFGGPSSPADISAVESLIPAHANIASLPTLEAMHEDGLLNYIDLEAIYLDHVRHHFDMEGIKAANIHMAYDAMYGAGQRAVAKLFPDALLLHCEENPSFMGQAPEPLDRNLKELAATLKSRNDIDMGLANDGDADRIGLYDAEGNFVDSHHILLLLMYYLHKYKGMSGKVAVSFSATNKLEQMAKLFGLPYEVTKIGFKYIAEIMTQEDVLIGGEESGGIAVKGHIPERDGIWSGLLVFEFMAKTGKTLKQLIEEVYALVGPFSFERDDLHITEAEKQAVIKRCQEGGFTSFGPYKVQRVEDLDGFKYFLDGEDWLMIRASGTEPVLRVYAQAPTAQAVRTLLDAARKEMLG